MKILYIFLLFSSILSFGQFQEIETEETQKQFFVEDSNWEENYGYFEESEINPIPDIGADEEGQPGDPSVPIDSEIFLLAIIGLLIYLFYFTNYESPKSKDSP